MNGSNGHARVRVAPPPPEPEPGGRPTLAQRVRASPITFLIALVNVGYFVWIERHGSSSSTEILVRFGAVESTLVRAGDYWRIASYMIVHIGWGHLLMNTWAGASWCIPVERIFGPWRFLLLYVIAGLGGGAAVVVFSDAVTAGASGAMFGIIGALLTVRYRQLPTWKMFVNDRGVRSTVAQIALWTVIGVVALPMSQAGHFGGLVTGALFTYALTTRVKRSAGLAAFAAAFAGFMLFAAQPWARGSATDWSKIKVSRIGMVEDSKTVYLQAGPACQRGVERACVIKAILELDPREPKSHAHAVEVFEAACDHGDKDACAGLGILVADKDLVRGERLLKQACTAGSEWGCEYASPEIAPLLENTPAARDPWNEGDASTD